MGGPEDAGRNREMRFQAALDYVLTEAVFQPKDERIFYGLYQQIMFGDCTEPEPANGTTDELKDYQSWLFFKGLDAIRGKELYVITLEKLAPKFNADNYGGPEFEKNTMKSIKTRLSKLDSMGLSKNPHTSVSQSIRDKRISSTMVSVTAVASQKGIKRNTARSKKKTSVANYQGSRIRTRPTTELPHVANVYIPQLPSVADPYSEAGRKEMLERMSGGLVLPSGGTKMDSMAFADLRERLITFYRRVAPERIKAGLGNILQFAEENGEEALNKELRDKYGQDLDFLSPKEKPDPYLENIVSELDIDFNKKKVSPNGKLKKEIKNYKKLLVKFLQKNESSADKIEKYLHFMNKYLDEKGIAAMNEKLKEKYGKDIDLATRQTGATPKSPKPSRSPKSPKLDLSKATKEFTNMSRKDAEMLQIYFEKYDPRYLQPRYFKEILHYAEKYGMKFLNYKLNQKYMQSLDEFVLEAQLLHNEVFEFYNKIDKSSSRSQLKKKVSKILHWGLLNGRDQINRILIDKYGADLDSFNSAASPSMPSVLQSNYSIGANATF